MKEEQDMSKCIKCNTELEKESKFCKECGTPVQQPQSAAEIRAELKFWKTSALILHVVAAVLFGTFLNIFDSVQNFSAGFATKVFVNGAAFSVPAIAIGLLGLTNRKNRIMGFVVVTWTILLLMLFARMWSPG